MTFDELYSLARRAGFPEGDAAATAAAIALAESGGNPTAVGDGGTSFGLWQVHTPAWPQYDATSLLDPTYNAQAAFHISQGGTNFQPWSTFNSGSYKRYLAPAPTSSWAVVGAIVAAGLFVTVAISEGYLDRFIFPRKRS